jgi:hypothetical protein
MPARAFDLLRRIFEELARGGCANDPALKRIANCETLAGALKHSFPHMNVGTPSGAELRRGWSRAGYRAYCSLARMALPG